MKKRFILFMVGSVCLCLTGCNFGESGKKLTCTGFDGSNNSKQELKYVMTFNNDGTSLKKVDASIKWVDAKNVTADIVEESFCNYDDIVKDTCKVTKNKNGAVELTLSRTVLESDEVILGDFSVNDNETYDSIKELFEEDNWNSIEWSCK